MYRKKLSPEQALQKARHYCRYQERCPQEVKQKLFSLGLTGHHADAILEKLTEDDFLNEERFALQFAGGKFRLKQWGRQKIRYELRLKKISTACIEQALAGIETEEYEKVLNALVRKKWDALTATEGKSALLKAKLLLYLSQKGYEAEEVRQALKKIEGPE